MDIKFLDLKAQYLSLKEEIDCAISGVINDCSFALGPAVSKFEADFAEYCGTKYCIGVDSGTTALFLSLKAIGIGEGDQVIAPANTFIATIAAIVNTGATPVLVDVDPLTRNIDISQIESAIGGNTKAIMPVHLYGSIADMDAIGAMARKHNLLVIEDAAQAQGAEFNKQRAGSFGLTAGFSFYPGKNLGAYGEAGAIVTSDENLDRKLRMLRDHGSERKYYHDFFGYNARMHGIQGAVLGVKLKYLDQWNRERNRVANQYRQELSACPIGLPKTDLNRYDVYHQFVIEVDKRDKLQKYLIDNGVPTLIHYPIPIHRQKAFVDKYGDSSNFPVADKLADRILSLPIYPEMTEEMIAYVCQQIKKFF